MILYSAPGDCPACELTKKLLRREGIDFDERSADDHPAEVEALKARFGRQAPLVLLPSGEGWSGFRPDLISQHFRG